MGAICDVICLFVLPAVSTSSFVDDSTQKDELNFITADVLSLNTRHTELKHKTEADFFYERRAISGQVSLSAVVTLLVQRWKIVPSLNSFRPGPAKILQTQRRDTDKREKERDYLTSLI